MTADLAVEEKQVFSVVLLPLLVYCVSECVCVSAAVINLAGGWGWLTAAQVSGDMGIHSNSVTW